MVQRDRKNRKDLVKSIFYRFPYVEIEIFTKDIVYVLHGGVFQLFKFSEIDCLINSAKVLMRFQIMIGAR